MGTSTPVSRVPAPDDLGRLLGDIDRRLRTLEGGGGLFVGTLAVGSQIGNNTQTTLPATGVTGPPTGLGGNGGEVVLSTITFSLARPAKVWIVALATDYVLTTAGAFTAAHPLYLQIDATDDATAQGVVGVYKNTDVEARAATSTLMEVAQFSAGPHTVKLIWNSMEGTLDTLNGAANPMFAFLLPS